MIVLFQEIFSRKACGKTRYRNAEYKQICDRKAEKVLERYKHYLNDDYKVLGFICVTGTFIESIQTKLKEQSLNLEFIGVRIKDLDKTILRIKEIILN